MSQGTPRLRIGCAVWANRDWVGPYFAADTRPGGELRAYGQWCDAVEANTTFYAVPPRATVQRWADQVPDDFRFVAKMSRGVTHDRRLRDADRETRDLLDALDPLGDRLGAVWLQLPPTFGPGQLADLDRYLTEAAGRRRWVVEVRHPAFAAGEVDERALNELLHRRGADRVLIDTRALFDGPSETPEELEAVERKPRLTVRPHAVGRHPVVRFIGQVDAAANEPYWRRWLPKLAHWLSEGREPYFFFHTPGNATAPAQARAVHAALADIVDGLAPLPTPPTHPDQLSML